MSGNSPGVRMASVDHTGPAVRTFLIADVRGYTRFTQTRGDEAAAQLAAHFAREVQEIATSRGGRLIELRGDEALVVFESPRLAVRCALDLQSRFVEATISDPRTPLGVGIGIDSGEAVAVGDGYRGGALNVAARLCSLARAGEILASSETCRLAQRLEGVTYIDRGRAAVKGIDDRLGVVRISPAGRDPTAAREFREAINPPDVVALAQRRKERRRALVVAVATTAVLFTALGALVDRLSGVSPLPVIGTNAVGLIGLGNNTLHQRIPVGAAPGAIAADKKAVWVVNTADSTVTRIDLGSGNQTTTIPVAAGPSGIAVGVGAVWVTNADSRSVTRINPNSRKVVDSITVGIGPTAIATGFGKVWVADSIDDAVAVIDPGSDKVVATLPVGTLPSSISTGFGSVWVANAGSSSVLRIDPVSRVVIAAIQVGNSPRGLTTDASGVWATNTLDNTVTHIDPNTNSVAATVRVGREPVGLTESGDAVWVANTNDDSVSRIDPTRDRVTRTIHVGNAPEDAVVAHGNLWVTARGSAREHRGGALRVIAEADGFDSLDPATVYTQPGWGIDSMLYDGLVTYARTAGPAGALVVPDLASELPHVTDGGRTYVFTLRHGMFYSNGLPVRASDFRASMERTVALGVTPYFSNIVGSSACSKKRCDLSAGIRAVDATGTITVRLTNPDPDFLYKLAMPWGEVLPAGLPLRDLGFAAHPATGPYFLATSTKTQLVLHRNPRFVQWSAAAQPSGYPDSIDIALAPGQNNSRLHADVQAVLAGRYDWTPDFLTGDPPFVADLARTHTTQLHPYAVNGTFFYFLNTTVAPFNDLRVRQAVNYAIDRSALTAAFGGPVVARPTCQILPPTVAGYQPYCPYTSHPSEAGTWDGPDIARARSLIRAAHAEGVPVEVLAGPIYPDTARLVAAAMNTAGLRATIRTFPNYGAATEGKYFAYIGDQRNHVQTGIYGWYLDYPASSNQFQPLLTCASRSGGTNDAFFCDPAVDRAMAHAQQQETADPGSARSTWAEIDRQVTEQAPWLTLVSAHQFDLVSERLGNYQNHSVYGMLIDQAWVK